MKNKRITIWQFDKGWLHWPFDWHTMESLLPPSWYPESHVYERHVPTVTPPSRYRPLLITGRTSGHVACEGGAVSKITLINCLNGNGENY